jgi:hypothetical protein
MSPKTTTLSLAFCFFVMLLLIDGTQAWAQRPVTYNNVSNGANVTIVLCSDGRWQTTTPDGRVYQGSGTRMNPDGPRGSGIVINPRNPLENAQVTPPTQNLPLLVP